MSNTACEHMNRSSRCLEISYSSSSSTLPGVIHEYNQDWIRRTIQDQALSCDVWSRLTQLGMLHFQPMLTRWYPHVTSDALTKIFLIADWISLLCCGSASFIKNKKRFLRHSGIRLGIASLKTHQKLNLCWFGIKIHNQTICLPIDSRDENVRRQNPLLLEWDVTSTQITSGHNLNNLKAGFTIQATAMNSASSLWSDLSSLSSTICWDRHAISDF